MRNGVKSTDVMSSANTIPESMFESCSNLTRIVLPSSLEQIGNRAFYGTSLLTIDIPQSVVRIGCQSFQNCSRLQRISISGDPMIDKDAFKNATKLHDVYVKSSTLLSADNGAFSNFNFTLHTPSCSMYKNATKNRIEKKCEYAGKLTAAEPVICETPWPGALSRVCGNIDKISDLKVIGQIYASELSWLMEHTIGCGGALKRLDLSEAEMVKSSDERDNTVYADNQSYSYNVFSSDNVSTDFFSHFNIRGLEYLGLPNGITEIGLNSFAYNSELIEVSIPKTVKKIDNWAFRNCESLSVVHISNGVTVMGYGAFAWCNSLYDVELPESLEEIVEGCFYGCTSLQSVAIPKNVHSIGGNAFENCTSLQQVYFGSHVPIKLEGNVFSGCCNLKTVVLNNNVVSLGEYCFSRCSSLETIGIPENVEHIGNECFAGCSNLKAVYVYPKEIYASKYDDWHFKGKIPINLMKPYLCLVVDNYAIRYYTLCLRNRVILKEGTFSQISAVYAVKGIDNDRVILSKITNGILEPGVAYVVEGLHNFRDFYLTFTLEEGEFPLVENALFQGVYEDIYAPAGSYVLQRDGKFHIVAEDNTIKVGAYHAYLNVPMNTNEPQLVMEFDDGGTTGVDCVTEVEKKTDNRLYDLMGRRIITPQKGHIYVRGNKKIIY